MNIVKIEVLDKEITRKQFLQLLAGSSLALFGANNFIAFFHNMTGKTQPLAAQNGADFGTRKFGV